MLFVFGHCGVGEPKMRTTLYLGERTSPRRESGCLERPSSSRVRLSRDFAMALLTRAVADSANWAGGDETD